MRIAMLGCKAVPAIGGIAHYVEELGAHLADRGHEVTVYCRPHYLNGDNGPYRGMNRITTRGIRGKHLDAATHTLTSALHALRSDFDIVHIHGIGPAYVAPLLRLKRHSHIVVTLHSIDWRGAKWGKTAAALLRASTHALNATAEGLTCVSESLRDDYEAATGRRALYIPTGVPFPELCEPQEIRKLGLTAGEYIFCASRLVPEKGLHYLTEAFADIPTGKVLVIAGDTRGDDAYVRRIKASESDKIRFIGYIKGRLLAELYSNSFFYIQPSELEGLSVSVLEALSYGRCVLASDIRPNVEALANCGYTFRSGDVGDLRARILMLLENPDAIAAEFTKAREYIRQEHSWSCAVDRFEALYTSLLSGSSTRP